VVVVHEMIWHEGFKGLPSYFKMIFPGRYVQPERSYEFGTAMIGVMLVFFSGGGAKQIHNFLLT